MNSMLRDRSGRKQNRKLGLITLIIHNHTRKCARWALIAVNIDTWDGHSISSDAEPAHLHCYLYEEALERGTSNGVCYGMLLPWGRSRRSISHHIFRKSGLATSEVEHAGDGFHFNLPPKLRATSAELPAADASNFWMEP
ncbi:hypothetical protein I6F15_29645 [Bradyrhizobium sp. BRP14]|nr:hypothetical protein [Bradyrhizobium sp. BRP14]